MVHLSGVTYVSHQPTRCVLTLSQHMMAMTWWPFLLVAISAVEVVAAHRGTPKEFSFKTAWVGNTWGGAQCENQRQCWVQASAGNAIVSPETGRIYTNSGWDEGGNPAGVYFANGSIAGGPPRNHQVPGLLGCCGNQIAVDSGRYLYLTTVVHTKKDANASVGVAIYRDEPVTGVTPPGGFDPVPIADGLGVGREVRELAQVASNATSSVRFGLAVCDGATLLVSRNDTGEIHTLDGETLAIKSTVTPPFPLTPGVMTCGAQGMVWVSSGSTVIGWHPHHGRVATITGLGIPGPIAFDEASSTLLVADVDPHVQQVLFFDVSSVTAAGGSSVSIDTPVSVLGDPGGVFSGPAELVGVTRGRPFAFVEPITGVGVLSNGSIVVSSGPMTDIRRFDNDVVRPHVPADWATVLPHGAPPRLTMLMRLINTVFQKVADASPADPSRVYSPMARYVVNYSAAASATASPLRENPFWELEGWTYYGGNGYDDARVIGHMYDTPRVAVVGGVDVLFTYFDGAIVAGLAMPHEPDNATVGKPCTMMGTRQDAHPLWEAAVTAGLDPNATRWGWYDRNGNGRFDAAEFTTLAMAPPPPPKRERRPPPFADSVMSAFVDDVGAVWQHVSHSYNGTASETLVRYSSKSSVDAHGCAVIDFANPEVVLEQYPPAPFNGSTSVRHCQDCGRFYHDVHQDRLWVGHFTLDQPNSAHRVGIGGEVGSRLCYYDGVSKSTWDPTHPRATHCFELPYFTNTTSAPYPSAWSNMTHALAVAGDCAFIAMLADPGVDGAGGGGGLIYVCSIQTGGLFGTINPNTEPVNSTLGGVGWVDIKNGLNARLLPSGDVVVFEESVFYAKVNAFIVSGCHSGDHVAASHNH